MIFRTATGVLVTNINRLSEGKNAVALHSPTIVDQQPEQTGFRAFVRRRPLIVFFVLANLLSWAAWTPYILSNNGLGILDFSFPVFLGTSQFAGVLPGAYLGPIFSAFLVTLILDGKAGVRQWVGRLFRFRVRWWWYPASILGVPAVLVVTALAVSDGRFQLPSIMVLVAYLPGLVLQMLTTGLAEEPGWREFAMPRLQQRFGPIVGTLILGPVWAAWHFPLFFSEWGGWPNVDVLTFAEFTAGCVAFSFVMTWVFNQTGESLPVAMLVHTGINNFFSIALAEMFPTLADRQYTSHIMLLASATAALVLLVATRGRLGHKPTQPTA